MDQTYTESVKDALRRCSVEVHDRLTVQGMPPDTVRCVVLYAGAQIGLDGGNYPKVHIQILPGTEDALELVIEVLRQENLSTGAAGRIVGYHAEVDAVSMYAAES